MNSIVQINFNEAINPLTVSGTSEEVKDYIRVINTSDSNNIVSGKFSISSDYKTVEFKTDNKCAVNGCGEDIYCLPGGSNIKVELVAAKLFDCAGNNNNCSNKSPYSSCIANICTDDQGKFYPLASVSPISGIMDAAANSFDGNKDSYVNGPILYYDLNNPVSSGNSQGSIDASYAQGSFNIIKTTVSPKTYQEVYATEVTDLSPAPAYIAVTFNRASYDGTFDEFEVSIDASGAHMVGKNSDTGVTQNLNVSLDGTRIVGYSALTMALNGNHMDQTGYIGDSWRIKINKTVVSLADSITIGNNVYKFGSGTGQIPKAKGVTLATNITNFINANNLDVTATQDSTIINLQAKVAGVSGNNITLSSSDPSLIASVAFSGGADAVASSPSSIPGDNFTWSFWTSNKIETTPPTILSVTPEIGATSTDLVSPVKMVFNKLMMMTSLRTGEVEINNGRENIVHRLVNLIAGQLVGYWISSENLDVDPLDGVYDRTTSQIDHAKLYEGADYQAQIGSGVKDIYQNCFYPSTGMSCNLEYDRTRPYCCDGVASSTPCAE